MTTELPAELGSVAEARHAVRRFARELDVDLDAVVLAVSEAVANAVVHAYAHADGTVELRILADPRELRIVVRDHGRGIAAGGGTGGAGYGLSIIRKLARDVQLHDSERGVTLTMRFPRAAP